MGNYILATESHSYKEVMARSKKYKIPKFQRDYSWKEESWDDLWSDIIEMDSKNPFHYMGYLILMKKDNDSFFEVIDGQQRLTTISLIIVAAIEIIDELLLKNDNEDDKERRRMLFDFIGEKDPSSLAHSSKLFLNRNNDEFYQTYIIGFRKPQTLKDSSKSNLLLIKTVNFFKEKIKKLLDKNLSTENIARFIHDKVTTGLSFTSIVVREEIDAYKIFETLNTRGVKLSITDLLKNAIFSKLASPNSTKDIDEAERRWNIIIKKLGKNNDFDSYLRAYWNSKYELVRKRDLYKEVKKELKTKQKVFDLLDDLEKYVEYYIDYFDYDGDSWNDYQKEYIKELNIYNVTQPISLILSAKAYLKDKEVDNIIKSCSVISLRYSIISGLNPNQLERKFNSAAIYIKNNKETFKFDDFFNENLKYIYVSDKDFKNNIISRQFTSKKDEQIAKFLLLKYENMKGSLPLDINSKKITLEHILPKSPVAEWKDSIEEDKWEEFNTRIGNIILLEKKLNGGVNNQIFLLKNEEYKKSQFKMVRDILKNNKWTEDEINKRSAEIADFISNHWSIKI